MVLHASSWLLLAWLEMGLMKGLGAVSSGRGLALVAAGGGASRSPCTERWVGFCVPAGVPFPEELKHLMFPELGSQAVLGVLPYRHEIERVQGYGTSWPRNHKEMCHSPTPS